MLWQATVLLNFPPLPKRLPFPPASSYFLTFLSVLTDSLLGLYQAFANNLPKGSSSFSLPPGLKANTTCFGFFLWQHPFPGNKICSDYNHWITNHLKLSVKNNNYLIWIIIWWGYNMDCLSLLHNVWVPHGKDLNTKSDPFGWGLKSSRVFFIHIPDAWTGISQMQGIPGTMTKATTYGFLIARQRDSEMGSPESEHSRRTW